MSMNPHPRLDYLYHGKQPKLSPIPTDKEIAAYTYPTEKLKEMMNSIETKGVWWYMYFRDLKKENRKALGNNHKEGVYKLIIQSLADNDRVNDVNAPPSKWSEDAQVFHFMYSAFSLSVGIGESLGCLP